MERKISCLEEECKQKDKERESLLSVKNAEVESARMEASNFKSLISEQTTKLFTLETEISLLKSNLRRSEDDNNQKSTVIQSYVDETHQLKLRIHELEDRLRSEETVRRKLHNTIQNQTASRLSSSDDRTIEIKQTLDNATGASYVKAVPFNFDKVFAPESSQKEVFDEISQLVQSALDGYNVCIFAYGQTGSGKTYTMEGGSLDDAESRGMIPLAVEQIFASSSILMTKGDLLGSSTSERKHDIKHSTNGKTVVTDITIVPVTSPSAVYEMLKKALLNRAVASTNSNERSSRSHSVFTLRLTGKNSLTGESSDGTLNLIDLAGSERLSSSGSTGERLKETQAINKSLSSLGDVIFAISNRDNHVPFRNSKVNEFRIGCRLMSLVDILASKFLGREQQDTDVCEYLTPSSEFV
ncbi:kinesin-like nuclear fusion protein [Dinochytrium kinnereticum]|nr:kinesin-like nuclear fusion protein [Dinochytrium kinnereticum]